MKKLFLVIAVLCTALTLTSSFARYTYAHPDPGGTLRSTTSSDPVDEVNTFRSGDEVYVKGLGLTPGVRYRISIVYDQTHWIEWTTSPPAVPGTLQPIVTADINGDFGLRLVWSSAALGDYDILADCIDYGFLGCYDPYDALDDFEVGTAGFHVIAEIPLGTIAVLLACIASIVAKRVFF